MSRLSTFGAAAAASLALAGHALACVPEEGVTAWSVVGAIETVCKPSLAVATGAKARARLNDDYGFVLANGAYVRRNDTGVLTVRPTATGCDIRLEGPAETIEAASKRLFEWSQQTKLKWTVRDRFTREEDNFIRTYDRGATDSGKLWWKTGAPVSGKGRGLLLARWTRPAS